MEVGITPDLEPVTQVIKVDELSLFYGNFDGYSFCKDYYELSITVVEGDLPAWVTIIGNTVSIKAESELDLADETTLRVEVRVDGTTVTSRDFDVELSCDGILCSGGTANALPETVPVDGDLVDGFIGASP